MVRPDELGAPELRSWEEIQASDPAYASPVFSPQFTLAAGAALDNVFVGVIDDGFFPFQRTANGEAAPGRFRMADYEGVVAGSHAEWSAADLLRGCGLSGWEFESLIVANRPFHIYHRETYGSPVLDLGGGFDAYRAKLRGRTLKHLESQRRALERDHGPLRFELHNPSAQAWAWWKQQKTARYLRAGFPVAFEKPWVNAMLERIDGTLSLLYAGDRMVAAHLGLRSATVWHYWFPAYDRSFARYSPGTLLLLEMARAAPGLGIRYIDLGRGDEDYKTRFATARVPIARGAIRVGTTACATTCAQTNP